MVLLQLLLPAIAVVLLKRSADIDERGLRELLLFDKKTKKKKKKQQYRTEKKMASTQIIVLCEIRFFNFLPSSQPSLPACASSRARTPSPPP